MSFNLLDSVKGLFTTDLINKAADSLGESEGGITKAISGIVPSVLGGIVSKAGSGIDGASSVLSLAKNTSGSDVLGNLGNLFSGSSNMLSGGWDMAKTFFGDKLSSVANAISNFAGIKQSSATSLMSMVTPAALGVIGKQASDNNMSPGSLSNMLVSQKNSILSSLPSGLSSLSSMLGLSSIAGAVSSMASGGRQAASSALHSAEVAAAKTGNSVRWWGPVLIALLVIGLLIWLVKGSGNKDEAAAAVLTDTAAAKADMTVSTAPLSIKVKLPDGSELDAYKGGIEDMLVAYLNSNDPADSISNSRWFDFDNLNFKTGSAEITDESQRQINNIAAILKAYPKVKIKIGGYTDKTGNEDENMKLSQQRADAVTDGLRKAGTDGSQLVGAQGYGSQFAKADANAPDEDRKKDRRISVSVRSK